MPTTRVLLITDRVIFPPAVTTGILERASRGPISVHVLIPNPAAAEWHPTHPERHAKAAETRVALSRALPQIRTECGDIEVEGSVATSHDPWDAIEFMVRDGQVDEIVVALPQHGFARRVHHDLAHRLKHLKLPVTEITSAAAPQPA